MNAEVMYSLHAGGVTHVVRGLSAGDMTRAVTRLMSCHDHVFVVDRAAEPQVGVSDRGKTCLEEEFGDLPGDTGPWVVRPWTQMPEGVLGPRGSHYVKGPGDRRTDPYPTLHAAVQACAELNVKWEKKHGRPRGS